MAGDEVLIVRTGTANLASVVAGLRRAGAEARITESAADVKSASHLVLPGVGAFEAAMNRLHELHLFEPLCERIRAGLPTLCVCLGLQLLCEGSEESSGVRGLGIIQGTVTRFPNTVSVPQIGWNNIVADAACNLLDSGYVYFANSFRLKTAPAGWFAARANHGGEFIAAIERGGVLACQFHPELSGRFGIDLMRRWLQEAGRC